MARKKTASASKKSDSQLARIIEKNIHTIIQTRHLAASQRTTEERLADAITGFSGRMYFVYFHIIWFGIWILINLGYFGIQPFDPYPFGLLTMVVSLEAIFLATFVLISQNRLSAEADRRADLDLQIGLLTEYELTRGQSRLRNHSFVAARGERLTTIAISPERTPDLTTLDSRNDPTRISRGPIASTQRS